MLSYGGTPLHLPSADEANWIAARINPATAFGFARPKSFGDANLNPRNNIDWFLEKPFRLNSLYLPWGASRWGHAFALADTDMLARIRAQVYDAGAGGYKPLPFTVDDNLGGAVTTPLYMLPPVPLANIVNAIPVLGLHLLPLVDQRYLWWERAAVITVEEGVTTWANVYSQIAAGLGIVLTVDPISPAYLFPGVGLAQAYQQLPLLLDWTAASVGQRIVRTLEGVYYARNATTALSLQDGQSQRRKIAGGSLTLGAVNV